MTGRDAISTERKKAQGYPSATFQGLVCMTSNTSASIVFGNKSSMCDRILSIKFVPRKGMADPTLLKTLLDDHSGIINWFLGINEEIIKLLTRVSWINKDTLCEENQIVWFIQDRILSLKAKVLLLRKRLKKQTLVF